MDIRLLPVSSLHSNRAFTLIELLITIGIVAILCSIVGMSWQSVIKRAQMSNELSAGRQLITAYHAYTTDHDGTLIPGVDGGGQAFARNGDSIGGGAAGRYTWRLAPYLNYDLHGALLVNDMKKLYPNPHDPSAQYGVSISPSFGINSLCMGGYTNGDYQTGLATKAAQLGGAADIIVFVSAGRISEGKLLAGYHEVTPPAAKSKTWLAMDPKNPAATGSVHFRYSDKAVVVHYDGNITLESEGALRDMRKWNIGAIAANDPNFPLPKYIR